MLRGTELSFGIMPVEANGEMDGWDCFGIFVVAVGGEFEIRWAVAPWKPVSWVACGSVRRRRMCIRF